MDTLALIRLTSIANENKSLCQNMWTVLQHPKLPPIQEIRLVNALCFQFEMMALIGRKYR